MSKCSGRFFDAVLRLRSVIISSFVTAGNLCSGDVARTSKKKTKTELAETSHYIEKNILHWPMGIQDEYIASFGGFKKIEFEAGKKKVTTVKINQKTIAGETLLANK